MAILTEDIDRLIIDLESDGGDMFGALHTAHVIDSWERAGISVETRISDSALCASACPLIFFAADERYLSNDAYLLFHAIQQRHGPEQTNILENLKADYLRVLESAVPEFASFVVEEDILEPEMGDSVFTGGRLMEAFHDIALPIEAQLTVQH